MVLAPQPDPVGSGPSVTDAAVALATAERLPETRLVVALLLERRKQGIERYTRELHAYNGRSADLDMLQEQVDAILYATQAVLEGGGEVALMQLRIQFATLLTALGTTGLAALAPARDENE